MRLTLVLIALGVCGALVYLTINSAAVSTVTPPSEPGWETATDAASGIRFMYPATLGTTYITASEWPPTVTIDTGDFSCIETGDVADRDGVVAGTWLTPDQPACIRLSAEGAAGSTYRTYAYTIPEPEGTVTFTFTLRYPQCLNYDEPQQGECLREQETTDIDALVARMYATLSPRD